MNTPHTPLMPPAMDREVQTAFERHPLLEAYRVELCKVIIANRAQSDSTLAQRNALREALAELEPIAHRYGGEHPRHDLLMAATAKARTALALVKEGM